MAKTIIIGGAGGQSNLSSALIKTLVEHGYAVLAIARSFAGKEKLLSSFSDTASVKFHPADLTVASDMEQAVLVAENDLGPVYGYIHLAAKLILKPFLETSPADFDDSWNANTATAICASQVIIPSLLERGEGALLFLGATASVKGNAGSAPFACSKFAIRALSQSLAREFGPKGLHIAHLIIDGVIEGERAQNLFSLPVAECISAQAVADTCAYLLSQQKSCWTQELDIRPHQDTF